MFPISNCFIPGRVVAFLECRAQRRQCLYSPGWVCGLKFLDPDLACRKRSRILSSLLQDLNSVTWERNVFMGYSVIYNKGICIFLLYIGDMPPKMRAPHNTVLSGFRIMKPKWT